MAAFTPRLVCFDLDGTVMLHPNSLQYLLELSHAPAAAMLDIDRREATGELDWVAADYERAPFIAGLPVAAIEQHFDSRLETIANLSPVLGALTARAVVTALITSGPVEVAQALARRFEFDHCLGSVFETEDGCYTGRITKHLGSEGKVECLLGLCASLGISLGQCVAVGDGVSDLALFRRAGLAIGVDCSAEVAGYVRHDLRAGDLWPLVPLLLPGRGDFVAEN